MKFWFFMMILTGMALTISCGESDPNSPSAMNNPADEGRQLFRTHCVLCHGVKGDLQLNGAKVLGESELTLEERILVITNGRNAMTPFSKILSPEEIEAVANYTFSFKRPGDEQQ